MVVATMAPGGLTTVTVGWPTPFTAGFIPAAARVTVAGLVPVCVWLMGDWTATGGGVLARMTELPETGWILVCIRGVLWFTT